MVVMVKIKALELEWIFLVMFIRGSVPLYMHDYYHDGGTPVSLALILGGIR